MGKNKEPFGAIDQSGLSFFYERAHRHEDVIFIEEVVGFTTPGRYCDALMGILLMYTPQVSGPGAQPCLARRRPVRGSPLFSYLLPALSRTSNCLFEILTTILRSIVLDADSMFAAPVTDVVKYH